jgi:hypothetical protein
VVIWPWSNLPSLQRVSRLSPEPNRNRADAKRQVIADQQWQTVKEEDRQNRELLELSHQILELTTAIHTCTTRRTEGT